VAVNAATQKGDQTVGRDPQPHGHPRGLTPVDYPRRLHPGGPSWPEELATVDPSPAALWARGRHKLLSVLPRVAIVGTRVPTPYGQDQAYRFGRDLARAGVCIVSGLARGVDRAAHEGALDGGGATIAVLGCGVDRPWPAGPFCERMTHEGLLLSEFEPGTQPRRHHFPLRNRLISGLSAGVLVVEAAAKSGSLITARWAADQGRQVYVIPGRIDHPMGVGLLRLLRDGATPVGSPAELLEDLFGSVPDSLRRSRVPDLPDEPILLALRGETLTLDETAARVGEPTGQVLARLIELELEGALVRAPGGLYRLVT
jgi:DNA processing protein